MSTRVSSWRSTILAAALYVAAGVAVFWSVWTSDASTTSMCGCGDPAYSLWFMGFAAHAVVHGLTPLWTPLMWHPGGVNVLDGATQLGLGIPLSPLTALAGSIVSLNVALTLAPVLSALTMYTLVCRWVAWRPAAFVAGLLFGFSPFVLMNVAQAHLVVGMLAALPLIVVCLDELVVTQRRSPLLVGLGLAGLVVWQFFVSTEVLAMMALVCGIGLLVVAVRSARAGASPTRRRHALLGLITAAGLSVVVLAWPTWFALGGRAHVHGSYYPSSSLGSVGASLRSLIVPGSSSTVLEAFAHRVGAYQGPTVSAEFIGPGVLLLVAGGLMAYRRDRRLLLFGVLGTIALALSLGSGGLRPWGLFADLPLASDVVPVRFLVVAIGCLAVCLGLVIDHLVAAVTPRWPGQGRALGFGVSLLALAPLAVVLVPVLPLTAEPVVVPQWFATVHRLGPHPVVLPIPVAFSALQSSLAWQVVPGFRFAMAGGDGPGSDPSMAGTHRHAQEALMTVSGTFPSTALDAASVPAVAQALHDWGVTTVVLPLDRDLPAYDRPLQPVAAAALITAATGRLPAVHQQALVWSLDPAVGVDTRRQRRLGRCTVAGVGGPMAGARCVLSDPTTTRGGAR